MANTQQQTAHLESVTDYVEDKQLDQSKTNAAMAAFQKKNVADAETEEKRYAPRRISSTRRRISLTDAVRDFDQEKSARKCNRQQSGHCRLGKRVWSKYKRCGGDVEREQW